MADFDAELRQRLGRLAEAVPVQKVLEAARPRRVVPSGVAAQPRIRSAWLAPVAVLVIALVVASSLELDERPGSNGQPAPSGRPAGGTGGPPENHVVHATTTDGDFELELESPKAWYIVGEPIDISARLTYLGAKPVDLSHAMGAGGTVLGFGIEEPVIGDLALGPGWEEACVHTSLRRGEAIEHAFQKSAGWSSYNPRADEYRQFIEAPELHLPTGTWHVYAVASFSIGECSADTAEIRADIAIEVRDAAPAVPSDPAPIPPSPAAAGSAAPTPEPSTDGSVALRASDSDGTFELQVVTSRAGYEPNEAIDLGVAYAFVGSEPQLTIHHFEPEVEFRIEELGVQTEVFRNVLYDSSCSEVILPGGEPRRAQPITHNVLWIEGAAWPPASSASLEEGILRLPAGSWRITANLVTAVGPCGTRGDEHALSAAIELTVGRGMLDPPSPTR